MSERMAPASRPAYGSNNRKRQRKTTGGVLRLWLGSDGKAGLSQRITNDGR